MQNFDFFPGKNQYFNGDGQARRLYYFRSYEVPAGECFFLHSDDDFCGIAASFLRMILRSFFCL